MVLSVDSLKVRTLFCWSLTSFAKNVKQLKSFSSFCFVEFSRVSTLT